MHAKLLALAAGLTISLSAAAFGQSDAVSVTHVWARAMPRGAETAAAYATLESEKGDRLTGISTPIAQKAELHTMTAENGVMKMREVDGVDLPAGQPIALRPGGYHIMLTGVAKPLVEGQSFPLTLVFAKAGPREVTVSVQKVGAMAPNAGAATMPAMAH
jgi:periplasmic copper chaperone A